MESVVIVVVIGIILVLTLILTSSPPKNEKYELRDIPFGLGYGGYPPGLYNNSYPPYISYGMYGEPDLYPGYNPGLGLTW